MRVTRARSLRGRITRTLVGLGLVSVVLLATVNFFIVRELLDRNTRSQLESLRDLRTDAIELAIERLLTRVTTLGTDPGVADALAALERGYLASEIELTDDELDSLKAAYEPILTPFDEAGVEHPTVDELLPTSTAGRYVQYQYVVENDADDRSELVDAGDGSPYSAAHVESHEFLAGLRDSMGASDLLLVGLETGQVVYTTDKRVDIGTDITDGPTATAGPGEAYAKLATVAIDEAAIADVGFYLPEVSAPLAHVAATIRSTDGVIGALIVSVTTEQLTDIVNADEQWDLLGLGDTGEAYIVGPDATLRTVPRPWIDDPTEYLERFRDVAAGDLRDQVLEDSPDADGELIASLIEQLAALMEFTGTPVALQIVANDAVEAALEGETFVGEVDNYLSHRTVAASAPLDIDSLGWVVVTEQQTRETDDELNRFVLSILALLAVLLLILAIVGVVLARVLARPVRPLVRAARRIADGDYQTDVPDLGSNELGDVGRQLEAVATRLREQEAAIAAEEDRIVTMLASVLPDELISRVRDGDLALAETVDSATVVSLVVHGIPEPSAADQDAVAELSTRIADTMVELAAEHGVERGEVALERQIFVAGRGHPSVDADAAVRFAVAALDTIPHLGSEYGVDLTVRGGLSAGLVATGVLGSRQASFSVWGEPVSAADAMAADAEVGRIVADDTVVDELDDDWRFEQTDDGAFELVTDP